MESVISCDDGGCIVFGQMKHYSDNRGPSTHFHWRAKLDKNGTLQWEKKIVNLSFKKIINTKDGNFIILGKGVPSGIKKRPDIKIEKTDSVLNNIWVNYFGGQGEESPSGIIETDDGGYILIGHSTSVGGFGRMTNGPKWLLLKVDKNGNTTSYRTFLLDNYYRWRSKSIREDSCICIAKSDDRLLLGGYIGDQNNKRFWILNTDLDGNVKWDITE